MSPRPIARRPRSPLATKHNRGPMDGDHSLELKPKTAIASGLVVDLPYLPSFHAFVIYGIQNHMI